MGCGTHNRRVPIGFGQHFQYPLRAYGLWNDDFVTFPGTWRCFQYPLRAYGLWNY